MTVAVPTHPPLVYLKSYKTASTSFEIALLDSVRRSFLLGLDEPGLSFHVSVDIHPFGMPVQKNAIFFRGNSLSREMFFKHRATRLMGKLIGVRILKQHQGAENVRKVLGKHKFDSAYKITTIRNPWDLAVSRYRWMSSGREGRSRVIDIPFLHFIEAFTGNGVIRTDTVQIKIKTLRQHLYPFVYYKGTLCCNEYIRFENLESASESLFDRFGLAKPIFPKVKVSNKTPEPNNYRTYYDSYCKRLVCDSVPELIKDFGYSF